MALLGLFVGFNLIKMRDVERIGQTGTPSISDVQRVVQDQEPQLGTGSGILKSGIFRDGAKAYRGEGTARVVMVDDKPVMQFDDDFKTSSGPDLQVYLSKNNDVKSQGLGEFVSLGGLKSVSGAQVYTMPENHADYKSVVVWCRAFTVLFAQAELR